jgi:hypothetical protein
MGAWSKLRQVSFGLRHRLRLFGLRHRGVDRPRRWLSRPMMTMTGWVIALLALILISWMLRSVYVVFFLKKPWTVPPNVDTLCRNVDVSCGAISGWITSLLSVALASVVFLFWRFWRAERRYRARARRDARDLVPTAGPIFGRIVGRDDLCRVLMEDLRDRRSRRPHVLVGGVGTGKTAVLVLLTGMLAKRGAIPVPIRLRDAETLDFAVLAKEQFLETINERLFSAGEGEKIWRRLLQDGRVVVLADGLEEALSKAQDDEERDSKIRIAIRKAYDQRLPLLIASRPHTPLREMDAAVHELEPLSKDAALTYVAEDGPAEDERRLSWIVETADVADSPLYLQITKEIYRLDMLDQIATRKAEVLGTPGDDPSTLRVRLMQTWQRALISGELRPDVPLRPEEREVALVWLSALACAGLKDDSLEVRLDSAISGKILHEVRKSLVKIDLRTGGKLRLAAVDLRLAAAWGARLGLVEPLAGRVRFQHSLIQAFLGSQLMSPALRDRGYVKEALYGPPDRQSHRPLGQVPAYRGSSAGTIASESHSERTGPGREFLIALVLHSRRKLIEHEDAGQPPGALDSAQDSAGAVCHKLAQAAGARHDNKALDIYAAAMEISSIATDRQCAAAGTDGRARRSAALLASQAAAGTGGPRPRSRIAASDADDGGRAPESPGTNAHSAKSSSHLDLAVQIHDEWPNIRSEDPQTLEEAKLGLVCRFGEALHMLAGRRHECPAGRLGYAQLYDISRRESSYRIRLAAAQEIGRGGAVAYDELQGVLAVPGEDGQGSQAGQQERDGNGKQGGHGAVHGREAGHGGAVGGKPTSAEAQWAQQVSAWLAPLLIASADAAGGDQGQGTVHQDPAGYLEQWLDRVKSDEGSDASLTISQEIALAQGFKYAANRRFGHVHSRPPVLGYLQDEALEMLKHARYWFSQLTLIQALCLWEIQSVETTAGGQHWNPDAIVNHWLDEIGGAQARTGRGDRHIHPFVEAAAVLASRALETGHPERFLWMDESDLVTRVGSSREVTESQARRHDQWIQPSMGWSGLDRHAQQLVADVLLLLNLAERSEQPGKIEQWLERANKDTVPPCIRRDRLALKPDRTVGTAARNTPGSSCLDGCPFDLCPYPPKGQQPHRAELSEAFCRHQYTLLRRTRIRRSTARWQGLPASQMRAFWSEMANRARIGPAGR